MNPIHFLSFLLLGVLLLAPAALDSFPLVQDQAANVDELACNLVLSLDQMLAQETGAPPYTFDGSLLNRELEKGYNRMVAARAKAAEGKTAGALRKLRDAARAYETGATAPVSGTGFADDLANLTSFLGQRFTEQLLNLTPWQNTADYSEAYVDFDEGVVWRTYPTNEDAAALDAFSKAAKRAEREFDYTLPVCD